MWPDGNIIFHSLDVCIIANLHSSIKMPKQVQKFAKYLTKSKPIFSQRLLKICQSGEILPNLVVLSLSFYQHLYFMGEKSHSSCSLGFEFQRHHPCFFYLESNFVQRLSLYCIIFVQSKEKRGRVWAIFWTFHYCDRSIWICQLMVPQCLCLPGVH